MKITDFENKIIQQLQGQITDLLVEGYPDEPETFKLLHPKGALLVRYLGSDFEDPEAGDFISQERKMLFEVNVVARNLRQKYDPSPRAGAYEYLEAVRNALTGFQPEGQRKLFPLHDSFVKEEEGIWIYALRFVCPTFAVELSEDETLPLASQMTFNDETTGDITEVK